MTGRDVVRTFETILESLKEVLPPDDGWLEQERVKVAVELTKATALSISGRN